MIKVRIEMPGLLSDGCWARARRVVEEKIEKGEINPALIHKLYLTDQRPTRTKNQNSYYWAVVVKVFADSVGMEYDALHDIWKRMFAGYTMREFPGGKRRRVANSTSSMDTKQMGQYIERCIGFAAEHGIVIPEPSTIPDESYVELVSTGAIKG